LVCLYSTIKTMHGPINIRYTFCCSITILLYFWNRSIYQIMRKNPIQPDRPQMTT
jgi:hypothetical protein